MPICPYCQSQNTLANIVSFTTHPILGAPTWICLDCYKQFEANKKVKKVN